MGYNQEASERIGAHGHEANFAPTIVADGECEFIFESERGISEGDSVLGQLARAFAGSHS